MRVSTVQIYNIATNSIADTNAEIAKTQTQLSTGQRVLTPADDPVAATKIVQLNQELAKIEQYNNNIDIAENNLQLQESTLNSVENLIQRTRELTVQAGNIGTLSPNDYITLAAEVDSLLDEMVNLVNTTNASGDYIFAGYKGGREPFTGSAETGFDYQGDEGQLNIKISNNNSIAVTDSGKRLFVNVDSAQKTIRTEVSPVNQSLPPLIISVGQVVDQTTYDAFYPEDMVVTFDNPPTSYTITEKSTGNVIVAAQPYTAGSEIQVNGVSFTISGSPAANDQLFIDSTEQQGVLTTLARLSDAMKNTDGSASDNAMLGRVVADTLNNLDYTQTSVLEVRSELGARFNTLDNTRDLHLDAELAHREVLSELRDLDYAEASARLSAQTLILEAAQASFVRISQLSLFARL